MGFSALLGLASFAGLLMGFSAFTGAFRAPLPFACFPCLLGCSSSNRLLSDSFPVRGLSLARTAAMLYGDTGDEHDGGNYYQTRNHQSQSPLYSVHVCPCLHRVLPC